MSIGTANSQVEIGTTSSSVSTVGVGALAYSTTSGGTFVFSNDTSWNTLTSTVQKSLVSGYFTNGQTYAAAFYGDLACTEYIDVNNNFSSNTPATNG
jgi:hypothetical protein